MKTPFDSSSFDSFVKHHHDGKHIKGTIAITYTRVSTKEQTENNSLELQRRECTALAKKRGFSIAEQFGGTFESAKTDERKEFQRMISYAKRHRVSYIIVYSLDRFSRSGDNAIWLNRQLKELGIAIISVTQPIDTDTPSGAMMQNMLFLFAQHDNDQRRQKTVAGMQERLRKGEWCTMAPVGYLNFRRGNEKGIAIDPVYGPLVQRLFEWKANEVVTDVALAERLIAAGWKRTMNKRNVHNILKNPFYCGLIISTIIPGEVIQGKHEALVSQDLFLAVNNIKRHTNQGYKWNTSDDRLPLRAFVRCDYCGTGYAGYEVKAKRLHYYKCNKKGCKCNKSALVMHEQFKKVLNLFNVEPDHKQMLRESLHRKLRESVQQNIEQAEIYKRQVTELEKKLDKLSERFALGEIKKDLFEKFEPQFKAELVQAKKNSESTQIDLSNLEKKADKYLELADNLGVVWEKGISEAKSNLQNFVFPEGIRYDLKNNQYRTARVNAVYAWIALASGSLEKKETGLSIDCIEKSGLVAGTGLEPMTFGL